LNKLVELLVNDQYEMKGKTTFKEEFVTCGGIDLKEVDFKTMQSKKYDNLYFAGEILNIDGITGGFNFQAAWTTGWIAAQSI
jgi:predicted flavoprotein YhiN